MLLIVQQIFKLSKDDRYILVRIIYFSLVVFQVSVNGLDKAGSTPLHWAAHGGHVDCVKTLLDVPNCAVNVQVPSVVMKTVNSHYLTLALYIFMAASQVRQNDHRCNEKRQL